MTLKLIVTPVLIASACMAACLPVTTSRITGRDLAAAEPGLSALPANYTFGIAPEPGARRLFTVAELERIAAANHIARAALTEVCFEVPLRHLRAEDFARAP